MITSSSRMSYAYYVHINNLVFNYIQIEGLYFLVSNVTWKCITFYGRQLPNKKSGIGTISSLIIPSVPPNIRVSKETTKLNVLDIHSVKTMGDWPAIWISFKKQIYASVGIIQWSLHYFSFIGFFSRTKGQERDSLPEETI